MFRLNHIETLNVLPRWIIVVIDTSIFSFSILGAYLLRLNFVLDDLYEFNFLRGVLVYTECGLLATLLTRSFAGIIRYTGLQDALRVIYAALLTTAFALAINYMEQNLIPYSVTTIAFFIAMVLLVIYRLIVKELFAYYRAVPLRQKKVLVFGAGQVGMLTKQLIDNDSSSNIKVIGFLEDNPRKIGNVISGTRIYAAREDFEKVVVKNNPAELILSTQNLSTERKNELVDQCLAYGIKITTVPSVDKWIGGGFKLKQISEVKIEDLLGRNVIVIKNKYVFQELRNKTILITGAAGSIGSELVRQVVRYSPGRLIIFDQSETGLFEIENEVKELRSLSDKLVSYVGDVTNETRLRQLFEMYRPAVVFHAAAYKHVPMMEVNVSEAVTCNVLGTKFLADLSVEFGVDKFVMISTDKAVNPTSVMGATKRAAEIYVQSLSDFEVLSGKGHTKFITTRFGNVLGSSGSVIPTFKKQISKGGPITVTHPEITRYFMTIEEACSLVLEAGTMGKGGEIFVFDMGEPVKIADLARRMIQMSGLKEGKDIVITYTGLRPGEKLFEELLSDAEGTLATHHPKIMIAEIRKRVYEEVREYISNMIFIIKNDLESGVEEKDFALVKALKSLVPDYKSESSQFQLLDIEKN